MPSTKTLLLQATIETAIDKENSLLRPRGHLRIKRYKIFSRQRVGSLTKILQYRHGNVCDTDDAETYFNLVAPFLVQASAVEGGNAVAYVMKWCKLYIPAFADQISPAGIEPRVNAMIRQQQEARRSGTRWTPEMPAIVEDLQLTLEEVRAIGLLGFGSINPPSEQDKRLSHRNRMIKLRRERGVKPQAERTRTKCDKALADAIGRSLRTIQLWRRGGRLDEMVRPLIEASSIDFAKLCSPSSGEYGAHTFAKSVAATNDNARLKQSA